MPTECSRDLFGFEAVEGRQVVAAFDGGQVTSDAGALLLGAANRAIGLVERFAGCFADGRRPELVEHERRDHADAAHLRPRAGLRGPGRPRRAAPRSGAGDPGRQARGAAPGLRAAGRQEHAEPAGACAGLGARPLPQDRPRPAGDRAAVRRPVPRGARQAAGADHPRSRCHRRSAARPPGGPLLPRLLRLLLLPAAVRLLRPASAGRQAAALEHRRRRPAPSRRSRASSAQIRDALAAGDDRAARRLRALPATS